MDKAEKETDTTERYPVLRIFATLYKIIAFLSPIAALLIGLSLSKQLGSTVAMLIAVISGIIAFLIFYATAEGILVFIDIEANTRKIAEILSGKELTSHTRKVVGGIVIEE